MQSVLSDEHIKTQMMSLKAEYPTGLPWPNANYYDCAGFAFMLSDEAFGGITRKEAY